RKQHPEKHNFHDRIKMIEVLGEGIVNRQTECAGAHVGDASCPRGWRNQFAHLALQAMKNESPWSQPERLHTLHALVARRGYGLVRSWSSIRHVSILSADGRMPRAVVTRTYATGGL